MRSLSLSLICYLLVSNIYAQDLGEVLFLNGTDDYFTIPDNERLNQTDTISIEAWINICDLSGRNEIVNKNWCQTEQNAFSFRVRDAKLEWVWDTDDCSNGANVYQSVAEVVLPDTWTHVAITHTPDAVAMYVNGTRIEGELASGEYSTIKVSSEPLLIGTYKNFEGDLNGHFGGLMDEVRIWDYKLEDNQVLDVYNAPLEGSEPGLVLYLNMDNSNGEGSELTLINTAKSTGDMLNAAATGTVDTPSIIPFNSYCNGDPNRSSVLTLTEIEINGHFDDSYNMVTMKPVESSDLIKITLQRSMSAVEGFEDIMVLDNSDEFVYHDYNITDNTTYYYRLYVEVELGRHQVSPVLSIKSGVGMSHSKVSIQPNPILDQGQILIDLAAPVYGAHLVIKNPIGQIVEEVALPEELTRGRHSFTVRADQLNAGPYFLQFLSTELKQTVKILVQ